jgi:hypothetical protein
LVEYALKEEAEKAIKETNGTTFLEKAIHTYVYPSSLWLDNGSTKYLRPTCRMFLMLLVISPSQKALRELVVEDAMTGEAAGTARHRQVGDERSEQKWKDKNISRTGDFACETTKGHSLNSICIMYIGLCCALCICSISD